MKEHPILFSGEMVMAILERRKTQTRRVVKGIYAEPGSGPYGCTGDRLWVREAWAPQVLEDGRKYKSGDTVIFRADFCGEALDYPWRPSIHMPRWASRITLEIVKIGWDWLQNITEIDALWEGCPAWHIVYDNGPSHRDTFKELWNSINAKRGYGWDTNPMVWVIEFKKL